MAPKVSCCRETRSSKAEKLPQRKPDEVAPAVQVGFGQQRSGELGNSARVESLDEVVEQDRDLELVKGGASTRMNKTDVDRCLSHRHWDHPAWTS